MFNMSSRASPSKDLQPESLRLQAETEHFTRKLELEKRRSMILDQEILEAQALLSTRKRNLRKLNVKKERDPSLRARIRRVEETMRSYEVKINQTRTDCRDLRGQIDSFRKQKAVSERYKTRLGHELERVKSDTQLAKVKNQTYFTSQQRHMKSVEDLQVELQSSKSKFSDTSKLLGSRIEHEKWQRTQDLSRMQEMTSSLSKAEVTEGIFLSRHLLKRWKQAVKTLAETYEGERNHNQLIGSFFDAVKEQSTITELEELVRVVKKTVEDEAVLAKYHNNLLEDIEKVKLELSKAQRTIGVRMETEATSEQELLEIKGELTATLERHNANLKRSEAHLASIEAELGRLTDVVEELKTLLAPWLQTPVDWDEHVTISNIVKHVQNLEDQFTVFMFAKTLQQKQANPVLAMVDLSTVAPFTALDHKPSPEVVKLIGRQSRRLKG
jgi:predicted nuclease with TOPRIM domain